LPINVVDDFYVIVTKPSFIFREEYTKVVYITFIGQAVSKASTKIVKLLFVLLYCNEEIDREKILFCFKSLKTNTITYIKYGAMIFSRRHVDSTIKTNTE